MTWELGIRDIKITAKVCRNVDYLNLRFTDMGIVSCAVSLVAWSKNLNKNF